MKDLQKWRQNFSDFGGWDTFRQRRVQEKEARQALAWILEQNFHEYHIIEVGCGNGYAGKVISEALFKCGAVFSYHFTDLLPECVVSAKKLMTNSAVPPSCLSFGTLDVYEADADLSHGAYNVIVSTGFISAATYKDAVPRIAGLLGSRGILIADFVNHFSPAVFLPHPFRETRRMVQYILGKGKSYHLGILGIRKYFGTWGLDLVHSSTVRFRRNPILCMFRKK